MKSEIRKNNSLPFTQHPDPIFKFLRYYFLHVLNIKVKSVEFN